MRTCRSTDGLTGSRTRGMIRIPGGTFRMGSDKHYPEEAPVHRVTVDGFWIDRTPVTNRQFRDFVRRHRARHRRGNRARPEGLSRRPAAPALCGLARVQPAGLSGRSPSLQPMVGVQAQGELAPSLWPGLVDQGPGRASGRACRLCRCGGLCPLGRQGPADRGRMGVRGPRRAGRGGVRLGRRVHAGRTPDGQHLAGRLSVPEHASGRLRAHLARSPPSRPTATASTT